MRHGFTCFALALALVSAASCTDDIATAPTEATATVAPKFTSVLLPSNEVPAVSNADQTGSGTVTVTLNINRNSNGDITAATADFVVTLTGFPPGTVLTGAHIHQAAAGATAGVLWNTALFNGELTLTNGSITFSKLSIPAPDLVTPQAIINNPSAFYFNVHSTINTTGAARGQLVRAN